MLNAHSIFFAAIVSQLVFGAILLLLTWRDPRSVGLRWLTGGTLLQLAISLVQSQADRSPLSHAMSHIALVTMLTLDIMGVRWFTVREPLKRPWIPWLTVPILLIFLVMVPFPVVYGTVFGRIVLVVQLGLLLRAALGTRFPSMRSAGYWSAGLIAALAGFLVFSTALSLLAPRPALEPLFSLISVVLADGVLLSFIGFFLAEIQRRLHEESRTDMLTGLDNRRAVEERAAVLVESAARTERPLSLLLLDIDHFKRLNDTWGHVTGDKALSSLARTLQATLPTHAVCGRVGGEEFAILLENTQLDEACVIANILRSNICCINVIANGAEVRMTVSIGVASLHPHETLWTDLMQRADEALYRAKSRGRNRVESWENCRSGHGETAQPHTGWRRIWRDTDQEAEPRKRRMVVR